MKAELAKGDSKISLKLLGSRKSDASMSMGTKEGGNATRLVLHFNEETVAAPAVPAELAISHVDDQIHLKWADNKEADLAGYNVYRRADEGEYVIEAMGITSSKYVDRVVKKGVKYSYIVRAVDTAGTESGESVVVEKSLP